MQKKQQIIEKNAKIGTKLICTENALALKNEQFKNKHIHKFTLGVYKRIGKTIFSK